MFKNVLKGLWFGVVALTVGFVFQDKALASSGTISISSSTTTVVVGNSVTVTATLSSATSLGSWDFTIGYDSSKLRLVSTTTESGGGRAANVVSADGVKSKSYTYTFKAIASGTASIYVSDALVYDFSTSLMSISKGSKSITCKTQAEIEASYSKNNYLSSLAIEGYTLSPSFSKDNLEYSVELNPETTSININASVEDSTASIKGNGAATVVDGNNKLEIVVTAQNGTSKTYVINANVKEYDPIEVKVGDESYTVVRKKTSLTAPANYTETTIKISDTDVPSFISEITKFTLVGLKDSDGNIGYYIYDSKENTYTLYQELTFSKTIFYPMEFNKNDIPKGYSKANIQYNDKEILAYKIKASSKYALLYGMNVETGEKHIYMYDSKEGTLQIYNTEELDKLIDLNNSYLKYLIIACSVGTALFLGYIVIIVKELIKKRKDNKLLGSSKHISKKDSKNKLEEIVTEEIKKNESK